MLKIAYIASDPPIEKPKKLSMKERIRIEAEDGMGLIYHKDHLRALELFAPEIKRIEEREKVLEQLLISKNLKP